MVENQEKRLEADLEETAGTDESERILWERIRRWQVRLCNLTITSFDSLEKTKRHENNQKEFSLSLHLEDEKKNTVLDEKPEKPIQKKFGFTVEKKQ